MHPQTVYAKTSKGVLEIKNKAVKLDRDSGNVFLSVDGKSTVAELVAKDKLEIKAVESILNELTKSKDASCPCKVNIKMLSRKVQ